MDIEKLMSSPSAERGKARSLRVSLKRYFHALWMSAVRNPQPKGVSRRRLDDLADVVDSNQEYKKLADDRRSLLAKLDDPKPAHNLEIDSYKQY